MEQQQGWMVAQMSSGRNFKQDMTQPAKSIKEAST